MQKIKIYIFHPYSRIGGADLTISRLINNLNAKKYEITFICLNRADIIKYLTKKIKIIIIKKSRSIFSIPDLRKIIWQNYENDKKYKKVIFISNQNFANIISILALNGFKHIKKILIERNNPSELDYLNNYKNKFIKKLIRLTYKYADQIIGISKELSKDLSKLCSKNVHTIYNPAFDTNILKQIKKKKISNKIILSVARFEKQKNHIMLLKAFKLSLKYFNSKLVLVGYGSEKQNIINYINKNNLSDKVKIVLKPKNPYIYYNKSNLFVLTSLYEGFGNVLVEAGMFRIPIISTNCKSGPKEILKGGKYGDLVKINDHKQLSKLIVKNLRYPNKKKIEQMYKSLIRFNIKRHIREYEKVFKKI